MVELPANARIDNLYVPGRQKPSQVLRTQNWTNNKEIAALESERASKQCVPQNQIHKSLDLERKVHEILSSSLPGTAET